MKKICLIVLVFLPILLSAQLMSMPEGISYWELLDGYFVSCWQSANVVFVNNQGIQSEYWSGLSHCANNLFVNDVLYVTYGNHVKAIDTFTTSELWDITLTGAVDADGLAMADDGFLYVVTHNNKVYRINVAEQTSELFAAGGIGSYDQGMVYDQEYNRLLICSFQTNCPIYAVNLPGGDTSEIYQTGLNNLDAMATDDEGNIYVSCFDDNSVYKFNNEFTADPVVVSSGHDGPTGIEINGANNILYVSNFYTGIVDEIQLPAVGIQGNLLDSPIKLYQNYPNPFNPSTTISFSLTKEITENTELSIYNMKGQKVKELNYAKLITVCGKLNSYSFSWNGKDDSGKPVSSGIYFYKIKSGRYVQTKKMILAK